MLKRKVLLKDFWKNSELNRKTLNKILYMTLEDRLYSESELRGKPSTNLEDERLYSQDEVSLISDLFDEFYCVHGDSYADVDEAYDEFIEAYSNVEVVDDNPNINYKRRKDPKLIVSKNATRAIAGSAGAGIGLAAAAMLNKKTKAEKKNIEEKMVTGRASSKDIERLNKIKKTIRNRKLRGAAIGAAVGYGGTVLAGRNTNHSEEDSYASLNQKNAAAGAIAGAGFGGYAAKKLSENKRFKELESLKNRNKEQEEEFKKLKRKIARRAVAGAVAGGVAGSYIGRNKTGIQGAYKAVKAHHKASTFLRRNPSLESRVKAAKVGFKIGKTAGDYLK